MFNHRQRYPRKRSFSHDPFNKQSLKSRILLIRLKIVHLESMLPKSLFKMIHPESMLPKSLFKMIHPESMLPDSWFKEIPRRGAFEKKTQKISR